MTLGLVIAQTGLAFVWDTRRKAPSPFHPISYCKPHTPPSRSRAQWTMVPCAGGQQDAQEAYEEAVNAIFVLQVASHRHTQPHQTHNGSVRWEIIEMWPMQVVSS